MNIAYYRVSTDRQGKSGLGLEAQRSAVERTIGGKPDAEYTEIESGRKTARPELEKAIAIARRTSGVLVVAKLDRLSRNARFLLGIVEAGVEVIFCDLPDLPKGPTGKFFLTMMAAVAELEAGMISERTKAALKAAKQRGTQLGNPEQARINQAKAQDMAVAIYPHIQALQDGGIKTLRAMAEALNRRGIAAPMGGKWHPTTVGRVMERATSS